MSIDISSTEIPAEILADGQAALSAAMAGKKLDPVIAQTIRERAEKITEEIRKKHGTLDIAVPAIRALRDA